MASLRKDGTCRCRPLNNDAMTPVKYPHSITCDARRTAKLNIPSTPPPRMALAILLLIALARVMWYHGFVTMLFASLNNYHPGIDSLENQTNAPPRWLKVFQVYDEPRIKQMYTDDNRSMDSKSTVCEQILMKHTFACSYGKPFTGNK